MSCSSRPELRISALLAIAALPAGLMMCSDPPPTDCRGLGGNGAIVDPSTSYAPKIYVDDAVGVTQTATGFLVPLAITGQLPCVEGVIHATVFSSAGQFSSSGTAPSNKAVSDAGTDASSPAADAGTQGANITITMSPDGSGSELVGFTTLSLAGTELSARLQVVIGDWSSCSLLVSNYDAGRCSVEFVPGTSACESWDAAVDVDFAACSQSAQGGASGATSGGT